MTMKLLKQIAPLIDLLGSDSTVVLHSGCAEPSALTRLLAEHSSELHGTRLVTLMPMGESAYGQEIPSSHFDIATFLPGRGLRSALSAGRARPLRYPISAMPKLFDSGEMRADVLLIQVSPPDDAGNVSLGISIDYMLAVLRQSPVIIAEINPRMPRTCGNTRFPASLIDLFVHATDGPQQMAPVAADETDEQIARNVASLVRDGAVIQVGIGSLPDCVLGQLGHLKHLGLHTGIVTDAVRPLIESGVIDNSTKKHLPGVCVTTMAGGTQAFYDFLHQNPAIEFHPCSVTHDAKVLAGIDGLCAINSALQVDLAGNVNAEQIGKRKISLPGGMPDFSAGASKARGGASIVAIRSTFGGGTSNILPRFDAATPVTVGPSVVNYIVTEYGVAPIRGASAEDRAESLIAIAHPAHRDSLRSSFSSLVANGG